MLVCLRLGLPTRTAIVYPLAIMKLCIIIMLIFSLKPAWADTSKIFNVRDYGAIMNGLVDDAPAVIAAQADAQRQGGGLILIPSGTLYLSQRIYTVNNNGWMFYPGASIVGPGSILGLTDSINSNNAQALSKFSDKGGQNGLFISHYTGTTNSTNSYENNGVYVRIVTSDQSTANISRDSVAAEFQGIITGTSAGRVWGLDTIAQISAGSDGYAVGAEIAVQNDGSNQPILDTRTSKIGINIVSSGTKNNTSGIIVQGTDNSRWQDGIVIKDTGIVANALRVVNNRTGKWTDSARIDISGNAMFGKFGVNGVSPAQRQLVTGSRAGCPALGSVIKALSVFGLVTDSTTP